MRHWSELELLLADDPIKGAVLSDGGPEADFRLCLWRQWDNSRPPLAVVMLNPSTADAREDDHTITRLVYHAKKAGYGGFIVVNLFSFRATDSFRLLERGFRSCLGPDNDEWIKAVVTGRDTLVAWGVGTYGGRAADVAKLITPLATKIMSLGANKDGSPPHPARLSNEVRMAPWAVPAEAAL